MAHAASLKYFVGNLPQDTILGDLAGFLGISEENLMLYNHQHSRVGQRHKSYGFINVPAGQEHHMMAFHGRLYYGCPLQVQEICGSTCQQFQEPACDQIKHEKERDSQISYRYPMIDAGAILTHTKFKHDIEFVIAKAKQTGVQHIVVTSLNVNTSKEAKKMCRSQPGFLYFTAGVHPHNAKTWTSASLAELEKVAEDPQCVAIGECGLDFNRNFSPKSTQIQVFEEQIQLACRLRKPLFLHEREAADTFRKILSKYMNNLPPTVVHCFTGSKVDALKYLAMGFYIGITGYLWKDNSVNGVRQLLQEDEIPLDKILLETNSPFMFPYYLHSSLPQEVINNVTPQTQYILKECSSYEKGIRNEPAVMALVTELVAGCMKMDPQTLAEASVLNSRKFFNLPSSST